MNTNDELRAELTKRGVEWWPMHDIEAGYYQDRDTEFVVDGKKYTAHEWGSRLTVYGLTPAQAIAATLGAETCKLVETEHEQEIADEFGKGTFSYWAYDCIECGYENAQYGRFCAGCGRKVVDE